MKPFADRMDFRRRQILALLIIGFGAAQMAMILDRIVPFSPVIRGIVIVISLLGWALFGVQLFLMFRTGSQLRGKPEVELALNDEFVRQKRWKAATFAFWAAIICQAAILFVNLFFPLDAGVGAQLTLTVCVVAFTGSFLYYDREDADA